NLTFDDAATDSLPASIQITPTPIVSGTFKPTDFGLPGLFPSPAPGAPYATNLSVFDGTSPNGTWSLYVFDSSAGDNGSIAGGWGLNISTASPVNSGADLGVSITGSANSVFVDNKFTYTVTVTNKGPAAATSVTVTDVLPPGFNFVSTSASAYTNTLGSL